MTDRNINSDSDNRDIDLEKEEELEDLPLHDDEDYEDDDLLDDDDLLSEDDDDEDEDQKKKGKKRRVVKRKKRKRRVNGVPRGPEKNTKVTDIVRSARLRVLSDKVEEAEKYLKNEIMRKSQKNRKGGIGGALMATVKGFGDNIKKGWFTLTSKGVDETLRSREFLDYYKKQMNGLDELLDALVSPKHKKLVNQIFGEVNAQGEVTSEAVEGGIFYEALKYHLTDLKIHENKEMAAAIRDAGIDTQSNEVQAFDGYFKAKFGFAVKEIKALNTRLSAFTSDPTGRRASYKLSVNKFGQAYLTRVLTDRAEPNSHPVFKQYLPVEITGNNVMVDGTPISEVNASSAEQVNTLFRNARNEVLIDDSLDHLPNFMEGGREIAHTQDINVGDLHTIFTGPRLEEQVRFEKRIADFKSIERLGSRSFDVTTSNLRSETDFRKRGIFTLYSEEEAENAQYNASPDAGAIENLKVSILNTMAETRRNILQAIEIQQDDSGTLKAFKKVGSVLARIRLNPTPTMKILKKFADGAGGDFVAGMAARSICGGFFLGSAALPFGIPVGVAGYALLRTSLDVTRTTLRESKNANVYFHHVVYSLYQKHKDDESIPDRDDKNLEILEDLKDIKEPTLEQMKSLVDQYTDIDQLVNTYLVTREVYREKYTDAPDKSLFGKYSHEDAEKIIQLMNFLEGRITEIKSQEKLKSLREGNIDENEFRQLSLEENIAAHLAKLDYTASGSLNVDTEAKELFRKFKTHKVELRKTLPKVIKGLAKHGSVFAVGAAFAELIGDAVGEPNEKNYIFPTRELDSLNTTGLTEAQQQAVLGGNYDADVLKESAPYVDASQAGMSTAELLNDSVGMGEFMTNLLTAPGEISVQVFDRYWQPMIHKILGGLNDVGGGMVNTLTMQFGLDSRNALPTLLKAPMAGMEAIFGAEGVEARRKLFSFGTIFLFGAVLTSKMKFNQKTRAFINEKMRAMYDSMKGDGATKKFLRDLFMGPKDGESESKMRLLLRGGSIAYFLPLWAAFKMYHKGYDYGKQNLTKDKIDKWILDLYHDEKNVDWSKVPEKKYESKKETFAPKEPSLAERRKLDEELRGLVGPQLTAAAKEQINIEKHFEDFYAISHSDIKKRADFIANNPLGPILGVRRDKESQIFDSLSLEKFKGFSKANTVRHYLEQYILICEQLAHEEEDTVKQAGINYDKPDDQNSVHNLRKRARIAALKDVEIALYAAYPGGGTGSSSRGGPSAPPGGPIPPPDAGAAPGAGPEVAAPQDKVEVSR